MVKKIRIKFIIVTMTLLIISVIAVLYMNTVYRNHLYRQNAMQYLELLSGDEYPIDDADEQIEDEHYTDIYIAAFDASGNILSLHSLGNDESGSGNDENNMIDNATMKAAKSMYNSSKSSGRIKSYIFISKVVEGEKHIIFANIRPGKHRNVEIMGTIAFTVSILILLLWVSFFLSKFVTDPATKSLEREKQFISDASHELKTPIAAIILNAQALSENGDTNKHLKNILSEAERMNKLIRKLLTLACIDESNGCLEKKKFSLSESCEEIVLPFESIAFENNIDFSYDITEEIYYSGVCDDIKQLISILLDNAFKYTPNGGKIKVNLHRKNHRPILTVYNEGDGISPEALPYIFDRFYCYEKSRSTHQGSFGLGLSIAKAIINAHSGDISAASEFGKYAEFTVIF